MWWNDLFTFPPAARFRTCSYARGRLFSFGSASRASVCYVRVWLTIRFALRAHLPAFNASLASQSEPCGRSLPLTARVETRPKQPTVADGFNAFTPRITLYTSLPSTPQWNSNNSNSKYYNHIASVCQRFCGGKSGRAAHRIELGGGAGRSRRAALLSRKSFLTNPREYLDFFRVIW